MRIAQQDSRYAERPTITIGGHRWRRAFTFIEMLVSVTIISILVTISALGFRKITESNTLAQAKNAVLTYAKIARSYAVANHIETMFVVNPFNGRFEIWHANPPVFGASWDVLSGGSPTIDPWNTDGYAFAPVLDSGARLPTDSSGHQLAAVHPIDYADVPATRPTLADGEERNIDNFTWAALCFDANGELVVRTRRIATRTYTRRDGTLRPAPALPPNPPMADQRNRLIDESPDLSILTAGGHLVYKDLSGDTPITSSIGFVISEASKMRQVVGSDSITDPSVLVNNWLLKTRTGQPYAGFADTIVLNRYSGHQLLAKGS